MLLYKDMVTDSEMFSDAFPVKLVKDIVYEVDCATITVKNGADVDIGANPSAEEAGESLEDGAKTVNNVVHAFQLSTTTFENPKAYRDHLKAYMKSVNGRLEKKLAKTLPEAEVKQAVKDFQTKATSYFTRVIKKKLEEKQYDFYTGATAHMTNENGEEEEGMVALLDYRDDGITPYFTFWKDGLDVVKL